MAVSRDKTIIGVDLGGTKVLAGRIREMKIIQSYNQAVPATGTENEVVRTVISTIDQVFNNQVAGIGIGVPSVVDIEKGIVYDVQNIPSWKEVPLKGILSRKYHVPVYINNDANCFAAGEKHFGQGKKYENFVALIVGTGIAGGIIINHKLYNGYNCGAGEFGMIPYLDHHFEYYCSGQFFETFYQTDGSKLAQLASTGEPEALRIFTEFGKHLGHAIMAILYSFDPELIILGGSVSKSYSFFKEAMWASFQEFAYHKVPQRLQVKVSNIPDIAVLGAGALLLNEQG